MSNDPTSSSKPTAYSPPPLAAYPLAYAAARPEKRLHPATILVQVVRLAKSIAIVLAFAIYRRFTGKGGDTLEFVAAGLGGLGILGAVLKYTTTTYAVRDGALHVRTGLFVRTDRVVPLERIQNINQKQELVHRLLGVVDLRVETASGGGAAEVELSVVSLAEADLLRAALARRTPAAAAGSDADREPAGEVVYRASLADLVLAGSTTNRLGTLLATALGVAASFHVYDERDAGRVIVRSAERFTLPGWTVVAGVAAGLVLLGWLASIAITVVTKYGFQLVRVRGQLERSYGLLTRHRSVFPVGRVQMLRVESPLIQRRLGLCHLSAETAGSFRENDGGNDAGTSELCPILRLRDADAMCRLALPRFRLDAVAWRPTSTLARRRAFVRALVVGTIATAIVALLTTPWAWAALAGVVALAWGYGWAYFRSIGYDLRDGHLAVRQGIVTRSVRVVPLAKVQASFVTRSPLQRRLGLASLTVLTAGGGSAANRAGVPDLALADARALQEAIHARHVSTPSASSAQPLAYPVVTADPE